MYTDHEVIKKIYKMLYITQELLTEHNITYWIESGTLLGAGGLARAYSHTAKLAIDEAGIRIVKLYTELSLECPYSEYQPINSLILQFEGVIESCDFLDTVKLIFKIPDDKKDLFVKKFNDLVSGSIKINYKGA